MSIETTIYISYFMDLKKVKRIFKVLDMRLVEMKYKKGLMIRTYNVSFYCHYKQLKAMRILINELQKETFKSILKPT